MKYLIIGNKGQLGREFAKLFSKINIDFTGVDIDEIDISKLDDVVNLITSAKPQIIINCSAYNNVDTAEQDYYSAYKTNSLGIKNLAYASEKANIYLVHYGTDYVFDGEKTDGLYSEDDTPNPQNEYGKSKLMGELFLKENCNNYLLLRLSWVFGDGRQNFIYKFSQWIENNPYLKVSCDETSVPTWTNTIVDVTMKAIEQRLTGLFHLTNSDYCTRFEWAKTILKAKDKNDYFIYPVLKNTFNLPAHRPTFSAMSNQKLSKELNIEIPPWEEAVYKYLKND